MYHYGPRVHSCLHLTYLLKKILIKIRTVAPYNHQSPQAEHGIKSLPNIPTKHRTNLRSDVAKVSIIGKICI